MVWVVLFWVTRQDFLKSHFTGPKYTIEKVVLPGRVKCGGTEGKIVVAHGCRKRKKLICGTEGEIVVAQGRLLSPAPETKIKKGANLLSKCCQPIYCLHEAPAVPYFHDHDNHYNQSNIVFSNLSFRFLFRQLFLNFFIF